ncbi:DUF58 domain-containing protein [Paenibacillus daejeonensis]|uniref:DUF58 domain-containing protein n=1 Tax=Paenibacillus daejeonensis TaxID=135193 RepID=UPI00035EC6B1|nr:DUF58 domain-containing protein [Paenibacillus daejeonensis]
MKEQDSKAGRKAIGQTLLRAGLLLLIWLGISAAMLQRGSAGEWLAWMTLTGLIGCGLVLPLVALGGTTASRELERELIASGDVVNVKLTVRTRMPLPVVWVSVREQLIAENRLEPVVVTHRKLVLPWLRRAWSFKYALDALPRGVYRWQSLLLTTGDLFGVTEHRRHLTVESCLWVAPRSIKEGLSEPLLRAGGTVEPADSSYRNMQPGAGVERRPYRTSDPLRHLDWRAAAKGRDWLTRIAPSEESIPLRIIIDTGVERSAAGQRLLDACAELALTAAEACQDGGAELIVEGRTTGSAASLNGITSIRQALAQLKGSIRSPLGKRPPVSVGGGQAGAWLIISGHSSSWESLAVEARARGARLEIWQVTLADGQAIGQSDVRGAEYPAWNGAIREWVLTDNTLRLSRSEEGGRRDVGIS